MAVLDSVAALEEPMVQAERCRPENNPDAAAYFITTFCRTIDEDDGGTVKVIPAKQFVLRAIRTLDFRDPITAERVAPANVHVRKSRRVLWTWIKSAYHVFCLQYDPTYSALLVSNGQDMVDDGGQNSTPSSMFGRMRFIHDHLPRHVWRPIEWAHMRAKLSDGDAYVVGSAPTAECARGLGPKRIDADEFAYLEHARAIHAAADPACRFGKIYSSTTNGTGNLYAELDRDRPPGWRFLRIMWHEDHEKARGMRATVPGPERERYGPVVSPWLVEATHSLTDDLVQQEYGANYNKAGVGVIYREWDRDVHVAAEPIRFDPSLPLVIGVDYGSTGFGAAALGQPVGDWELRVLADYELAGAGGAPRHAENIWNVARAAGYGGAMGAVDMVGGPDTDAVQTGSGQSIAGYFRAFGFLRIRQCRVRGPGSVERRIEVVRVALSRRRIVISPSCRSIIERFPQYRWPVNRTTGHVGGAKPALGDANNIMDALGYLACEVFPHETAARRVGVINAPVAGAPRVLVPDDGPRPWEREGPYAVVGGREAGTVWDLHRRDM